MTSRYRPISRQTVRVVVDCGDKAKDTDEDVFVPSNNALLLLSCLLLVAIWIALFTNSLPLLGGVLSFGGILVVIPTLKVLMSDKQRSWYAERIDALLFRNRIAAWVYVVVLAVILLVGFCCFQPVTFRVASLTQPAILTATLLRNGTPVGEGTRKLLVKPGSPSRIPMRRPLFGGPDEIRVSASGLPVIIVSTRGFDWPEIVHPTDFWSNPVLLIRAAPSLLEELQDRLPILHIKRTAPDGAVSECDVQKSYLGQPIWVGVGNSDISISPDQSAKWLQQAEIYTLRTGKDDFSKSVITASVTADCIPSLAAGDKLAWTLFSKGQAHEVIRSGEGDVLNNVIYPQELIME